MHLEGAEVVLVDDEGEGLEDLVRAEPHVAAGALVEFGPEDVGVGGAGGRPYAVAGHHQVVGGGEFGGGRCLGPVADVDLQGGAALLEDAQQAPAAEGGEAVAAGGEGGAAVADVDVGPARELGRHGLVDLPVGLGDPVERLVGEDDAEAEGVVGGVPLPDGDLPVRGELLGEGREVQSAGPSSYDCDAHGVPPGASAVVSSSGCWGPAAPSRSRTSSGQGVDPVACAAECAMTMRPVAASPPCSPRTVKA